MAWPQQIEGQGLQYSRLRLQLTGWKSRWMVGSEEILCAESRMQTLIRSGECWVWAGSQLDRGDIHGLPEVFLGVVSAGS